jgi:ABC-type branched-subunit amino acid transport system ATPase component/ABC-type branched-subunit amino acid transport system permease subunit
VSQVPVYLLLSLPLVGAFAMFALGIVVIHQSSRVLNLAHGAMAMMPAYIAYAVAGAGMPVPVALVIGVASGAATGVVVERVFVSTLRRQGATAQTVGTVAALGLLLGIAIKVWGTTPRSGVAVFGEGGVHVGASLLRWGQLGLFGVAVLTAAIFFAIFRFTDLGLAMRGAADNRRAASLVGVNPDRTTTAAWAIGGTLAALAGILLAPVTSLHPINLSLLVLPAFVAALIGGLASMPGALGGAVVVGVVQGMVPAIGLVPGLGSFATQVGAPQLVLTVLAFVVMVLRGQRYATAELRSELAAASTKTKQHGIALPRWIRRSLGIAGAGLALAWPAIASFSLVGNAVQACILALIAASLVLLTGWVGQISLAQAAFVGIGAFVSALLTNKAGIQFPLNLPIAAAAAAAVAAVLGLVALRVRGLYLAVATLIFVWMANEYLFRASWLAGTGGGASVETDPIGRAGGIPHFDFTERRTFFYVALAAAAAAIWALANLRDSKTGRAFFAVRGSEMAAASLGIDVIRTKLVAFALSGVLAGIAGNLLVTGQGSASTSQFGFGTSLLYLAIAVVGGLRSLGGAVAASIVFAGVAEAFFRFRFLAGWQDLVNAGLLAGVLLAYPGGLAAIPHSLGLRASPSRSRRREGSPPATVVAEAVATTPAARTAEELPPLHRSERRPVLEAKAITVRFGGLTAVDDVTLEVREGEIVGLIGPNGAGKTTMFNAISGLNQPAAGRIHMLGRDATGLAVHQRAALGLARTFQVIQLSTDLTVFENLLVATHTRNRTGALSHIAVTRPALLGELAARERVRDVIAHLGLEDVADRGVAGLPFGTLRMVELARALVTGSPLIMLDEPASGLDNAETDRLQRILEQVRRDLGVSILLIEHDVAMVTSVSDYMYVLEFGRLIAHGTPAEVKRDRAVVAAYLGNV